MATYGISYSKLMNERVQESSTRKSQIQLSSYNPNSSLLVNNFVSKAESQMIKTTMANLVNNFPGRKTLIDKSFITNF